jgi:hypothetical protein
MAFLRIDPLGVFNFYLTLIDASNVAGTLISAALSYKVAGFSECSGLEATVEVFDYKEGGLNDYVHNDFVLGQGKRKDGLIVLLDEARLPAKIWRFKRGIPLKWTGPSLNAAQSSVAIESLEISHEGLFMELGA